MLVTELRYVGSWFATAAAFVLAAALAIAVGRVTHLSPSLDAALFFGFLCAFAYIASALWLRHQRGLQSASAPEIIGPSAASPTPARYSPVIVMSAVVLFDAWLVVAQLTDMRAFGWHRSVDSFALLCISSVLALGLCLREWRRFLTSRAGDETIPEFTQRRLNELAAAVELPTQAQRRHALRPILQRGYIRLGLLLFELVLMCVLVPVIGILPAFFASFGVVAAIFLALHWLVDL